MSSGPQGPIFIGHNPFPSMFVITSRMRMTHMASVLFSQFLSFHLYTGGGGGGPGICTIWLYVPGLEHFVAKKCSSRGGGGGGVISQNAMQVTYISIMHCSLLVISLLICCQKEILRLAPAYIVKLQGILGYYPLPSWHKHYLANVPGLENFLAKDPPSPPPGMSTFWLTSARYAIDIRIAFMFLESVFLFFLSKARKLQTDG